MTPGAGQSFASDSVSHVAGVDQGSEENRGGLLPGRSRSPLRQSQPEQALAQEIRWLGLPAPIREHRFHPPRRYRFDFAWPEQMVAVEVEGGGYVAGRHTRGKGFEADCEKYNLATIQGWRILRVTPAQITSGEAIAWLEQLLLPF